VAESGASFLSTAHTDTDADRVVGAALDAAAEMRDAGLWPSLSQRAAAVRTREREQPGTDQASTERPLSELPRAAAPRRTPALSLSYFGDSTNIDIDDHYQLLLDGAEFADRHEFEAVWFPERHFHSFGGFSPNPAILASALAQRTERVALRAGSVVAPLHHPARIAEEWAMVDRMSGGRVGMAFASGWNDRDFVLAPGTFADRRDTTMRRVEEVRRLWRGEELEYPGGGEGGRIRVATFPRPVQRELPVWLTTLGSAAAFAAAGRAGTGVLTNLLHQDITELGGKIAQYRAARARAGHDAGHVTVLLHTLVGDDRERVRAAAAEPLQDYLSAALDLTNRMSPTERRIDPERLADSDREYLLQSARDKYIQQRSLIGGIEDCRATVAALADAGVDEIACFVDFGVSSELARTGLEALDRLRRDLTAPEPRSARPSVRLVPAPRAETVAGSETEADTVLPTTPNQRLVWAAAQFGPEASSAYNLRRLLRLTGDLDTDALRAAFRALVGRHEALRVAFSADGTEQRVREHPGIDLDQVDLSGPDEQQRGSELATLLADEAGRPFDLAHGPLIRGSLIRVGGREHLLCLTVHHVAVDGTAENVLLEELGRLYERELGAGEPLPAPPRLVDHVRGPVSDPPPAAALEYWRQRFSPLPAPLALTRAARPRVAGHAGGRLHFDFDAQLLHSVQKFGAEHGASPFMVVLAAYTLLLHRVAEQDDVVVGVPVSRRSAEGPDRDLVAYCANLLPIRSTGAPSVGFPAHLTQIRRSLLDAFDHETCSLADIMAALPKREVWGRPSVVSAVFSWDRPVVPRLPGITVAHVESVAPAVRFDLGLNVTHLDSGHRISWDYNAGLFDEDEVRRLHARFEELLRAAVGAAVPDDATTTVLELVDRFATERPDAIAVHGGTAPLGIGMAVERARTVAARLVAQGVRTGDRVGLAVEPGPGLLVGLLGILWSGGRCVPLGTVGDRSQPYPAVAVSDRVPRPDLPDVAVLDLDAWTAGPLPELPDVGAGVMALELGGSETLRHGQLGRAVAEAASTQAAGVLTNLEPAMVKPGSWIDLLAAAVGGPSVHWADSTQGTDTRTTEAEPSTGSDIVGELIAIWSQILERTGLTAESDFFEEGGDSIRAVQILSRIRTRFDRELPVDTFFDAPTIGDLAKRVATP
jgi:iturin family lipopeptide synthetase A